MRSNDSEDDTSFRVLPALFASYLQQNAQYGCRRSARNAGKARAAFQSFYFFGYCFSTLRRVRVDAKLRYFGCADSAFVDGSRWAGGGGAVVRFPGAALQDEIRTALDRKIDAATDIEVRLL